MPTQGAFLQHPDGPEHDARIGSGLPGSCWEASQVDVNVEQQG